MDTQAIQQISNQMIMTLDNPRSVKLQIKHISLLQKELRLIKKNVNATISTINQNANQSNNDTILSMGLDVFGKRRLAGSIRSETRKQIE